MPVPALDLRDSRDKYLDDVLAVADELNLGERGRLIGVMAALAESDLYMQASNVYPLSLTLPYNKVGKDKNSLGLFQQRMQWWGSGTEDEKVHQLMDAKTSARLFYAKLISIAGWQNLDPWVAAQRVQGSSFNGVTAIDPKTNKPYPYGQNYHDRLDAATRAIANRPDYFTKGGSGR